LPRWDEHDPTDLEELTRTTVIIIVGGLAMAVIIVVVVLALWIL
jgi:hypothetical protein